MAIMFLFTMTMVIHYLAKHLLLRKKKFVDVHQYENIITDVSNDQDIPKYATNIVYLTYAKGVRKEVLPALLIELSKRYFRQLNPEKFHDEEVNDQPATQRSTPKYQCSNCLTLYDPEYGDPQASISPGVSFNDLPETYSCHVCDSRKKDFVAVVG